MKKAVTLSIVFSVIILFTASVFAQPPRRMMRDEGFMEPSPAKIIWILKAKQKELQITDDQLEKIKTLVFSFEEKMIQLRSQASLLHLELRKLLQDEEKLDYEKIKTALSKASDSREEMFIERLKLREDIKNILTPEQREALKRMREEGFRERRSMPRGERFHPFPRFREREER